MKATAILFFCFGCAAVVRSASATSLAWDASPRPDGIIQYKLYERLSGEYVFTASIAPPQTRFDLPRLPPGIHTFAVTAVNALQESSPSNEVTIFGIPSNDFINSAAVSIISARSGSAKAEPYPAEITVSNLQGVISDVEVSLYGVSHRIPAHLDVLLVGPQGQSVLLMSDVGGSTLLSAAELTFADGAFQSLGNKPLVSGTYNPTNRDPSGDRDNFPAPAPAKPYGGSFSAFNGTDPNGTWKLFVIEEGTPRGGSISGGWSLRIATQGTPVIAVAMPTNVTSTTATLNGMITPVGRPSTFSFHYGRTTDCSSEQSLQDAGNGLTPVVATLSLTGLSPNTIYYYRLVGQNDLGASSSNDAVFITLPLVDSDRDGLPDDYEGLNHLNPSSAADAELDPDGDGISNLQEYLAGTEPNDRNSALRVIAVERADALWITFSSALGRGYQLQRTLDLAPSSWTTIQSGISGTGHPVTTNDGSVAELRQVFYRAAVSP